MKKTNSNDDVKLTKLEKTVIALGSIITVGAVSATVGTWGYLFKKYDC